MNNYHDGILQIEKNEIKIINSNTHTHTSFKQGVGKDKQKYLLIEISYRIDNLQDYIKYASFHSHLEQTINKINNSFNSNSFLYYYGVYYSNNKYYLVFQMPKNELVFKDPLVNKRFNNNKEINLKNLFSLFKRLQADKINYPLIMDKNMYFLDDSGNFQILYLGEFSHLTDNSTKTIIFPNLKNKFFECEKYLNNFNPDLYLFNQFLIIVLYTYSNNEDYLNYYNINNSTLENFSFDLFRKFRQLLIYYLEIKNSNKSDNMISHILYEYAELVLINNSNLVPTKKNNQFNIVKEFVSNLKSIRVEEKFFFDKMFNFSIFNSKCNRGIGIGIGKGKDNLFIDLTSDHNSDGDENEKSVSKILPKLFLTKKEYNNNENEVDEVDEEKEDEEEEEEDEEEDNIEIDLNRSNDLNESIYSIDSNVNNVNNFNNFQTYNFTKYNDDKWKFTEQLNFMYLNFPSSSDLYDNPEIPITVYKKDFSDFEINSIEKQKFDFLGKKKSKITKKKSIFKILKNEIKIDHLEKENGNFNKLFNFKKLIGDKNINQDEEEAISNMTKIWDGSKISEERVNYVLSEVEKIWPVKILSFSEEKCLMFLDLCNYDIFKTIFYIKTQDDIFIYFLRGQYKTKKETNPVKRHLHSPKRLEII